MEQLGGVILSFEVGNFNLIQVSWSHLQALSEGLVARRRTMLSSFADYTYGGKLADK